MKNDKFQRCSEHDCDLLSLGEEYCVAHRDYAERCEDAPCCGCCDPGRAVMP